MRIETPRLTLETISPRHARRIVAGETEPGDRWHPQYPLADELEPLRSLARAVAPDPVFTMYLMRTVDDGMAVGGLGFFGPPDKSGAVEIGYGLVAAARGRGLATEALLAALDTAAEHGALSVAADTAITNLPSRRALEKAGFVELRHEEGTVFYSRQFRRRGEILAGGNMNVVERDGSP